MFERALNTAFNPIRNYIKSNFKFFFMPPGNIYKKGNLGLLNAFKEQFEEIRRISEIHKMLDNKFSFHFSYSGDKSIF